MVLVEADHSVLITLTLISMVDLVLNQVKVEFPEVRGEDLLGGLLQTLAVTMEEMVEVPVDKEEIHLECLIHSYQRVVLSQLPS